MSEKPYYKAVARWFETALECERAQPQYQFDGLRLMEGDVVGWKDNHVYACEMKEIAYPLGAAGSGAIGQAIVLRQKAQSVYIGCVAEDHREPRGSSWYYASRTPTTRRLLDSLAWPVPDGFDEYLSTVEKIFRKFYGTLGLGLLVVHQTGTETSIEECEVHELVKPAA